MNKFHHFFQCRTLDRRIYTLSFLLLRLFDLTNSFNLCQFENAFETNKHRHSFSRQTIALFSDRLQKSTQKLSLQFNYIFKWPDFR